jgi:hypothetical protein
MSELLRLPHSAPGLRLAEPGEGEGAEGRADAHRREREDRFIKAARSCFPGADDGDVRRAANVINLTLAEVVHMVVWPDRRVRFVFGKKPGPTAFPPETSLFSGARSIVTEILKRTEKKRGAR